MALRLNTYITGIILDTAKSAWLRAQPPLKNCHLLNGLTTAEYFIKYVDHLEELGDRDSRLREYLDDLRTLLMQFSTVEQLEKEWPEIAPLLKDIPRDFRQFSLVLSK